MSPQPATARFWTELAAHTATVRQSRPWCAAPGQGRSAFRTPTCRKNPHSVTATLLLYYSTLLTEEKHFFQNQRNNEKIFKSTRNPHFIRLPHLPFLSPFISKCVNRPIKPAYFAQNSNFVNNDGRYAAGSNFSGCRTCSAPGGSCGDILRLGCPDGRSADGFYQRAQTLLAEGAGGARRGGRFSASH